jgi:hypothetical protein
MIRLVVLFGFMLFLFGYAMGGCIESGLLLL